MISSIHHVTAQAMQAAMHPAVAASSAAASGTTGTNSSSGSGSSGTSSPTTPTNTLNGDSFITLLTAQLQAQDPFNPVDPTTFMNELVQFNSLQQLIDINTQLTSLSSSGASGSGTANRSAAAASAAAQVAAGAANISSGAAGTAAPANDPAMGASVTSLPGLFSNAATIVNGTNSIAPGSLPGAGHSKDSGLNSNPNLALWSSQPSN
jgi:flagellar basal-body rod modification protein FlgD